MASATMRKFEKVDPRNELELKAILLMVGCFFYALVIFLMAALLAKATESTKSSVSSFMKRYQFWNVTHQTKLDMKHTGARYVKPLYHG